MRSSQIWLTFAPVADQSAQYLMVSLEDINWLSVVFLVVAIPVSFVTTWMLDTLGLRVTVQSSLTTEPPRASGLFPQELTQILYLYELS